MGIVRSHISKTIQNIIDYLYGELSAVFGLFALPGTVFIFLRFFFFIFFCNLIGLAPYIFTSSSHISFTLTLAIPIWIGRIVFSIKNQYNSLFAHLVLALLGSQGPSRRGVVILGLMVSLILLLCLELAVACIQAYVFTILRSLYLNELRTVSFNKNMV